MIEIRKWIALGELSILAADHHLTKVIADGGADLCSSDDSEEEEDERLDGHHQRHILALKALKWREDSSPICSLIHAARKSDAYSVIDRTHESSRSGRFASNRLPPFLRPVSDAFYFSSSSYYAAP
jgi:hypothetical protein